MLKRLVALSKQGCQCKYTTRKKGVIGTSKTAEHQMSGEMKPVLAELIRVPDFCTAGNS